MKKSYLTPAVTSAKISLSPLLLTSATDGYTIKTANPRTGGDAGAGAASRRRGLWDDED